MDTLRKNLLPVTIVALLVMAVVFFSIGRLTSSALGGTPVPTPTATPVVATPTPNLVLSSPRVLATFMMPNFNLAGPCETCTSTSFKANGPFDLIASCNPFQVFAGAAPSYQIQLVNSTGHVLDTLQEQCGDPNQDTPTTIVIPESQPAGTYRLTVTTSFTAPISVLILDASSRRTIP